MRALSQELIELSRLQVGLLTTRQLAAAGFRSREVRRRTARGDWQQITEIVVARQAVFHALWPIQRGLLQLAQLQALERITPSSPGTATMRRRLSLLDPGTHTVSEQEFATQCRARGLPEPVRQRARCDANGRRRYTDVEFIVNGQSLVVEIDGAHHLEAATWVDDQLRANELALQDARVLRVPAIALRLEPDAFFEQIRRGLSLLRRAA